MQIEIRNLYDDKVILCGEYESIKDCLEKNLGAYLEGANLRGAKEYYNSHDFWVELIRRQEVKTFTDKEWAIIGQIYVHRLCWDSIKKRYGKRIMPIFKKLSKSGFNEFENKYKEILADNQ